MSNSLPIQLEIKSIHIVDEPNDVSNFIVPILVTIGDKNDSRGGGESFHFMVASPSGIQNEALGGKGFHFLRGYILMETFDIGAIHQAINNLVNHARSRKNWDAIISFFSRYGQYESEDMSFKAT